MFIQGLATVHGHAYKMGAQLNRWRPTRIVQPPYGANYGMFA